MGYVKFTAEHLKGSRSSYKKGLSLELIISTKYHKRGIPLLVSPLYLREMGCGQIDIAYIVKNKVFIHEIKSNGLISELQIQRIKAASFLIAEILKLPVIRFITRPNRCI
jgi:hypothetical protein